MLTEYKYVSVNWIVYYKVQSHVTVGWAVYYRHVNVSELSFAKYSLKCYLQIKSMSTLTGLATAKCKMSV